MTSVAIHYEGHELYVWMSDRKERIILSGFTVNYYANLMVFVMVIVSINISDFTDLLVLHGHMWQRYCSNIINKKHAH